MYSLLKQASIKTLVALEIPSMFVSLVIAEFFYKFGSFTLECMAFLATWVTVSFIFDRVQKLFH